MPEHASIPLVPSAKTNLPDNVCVGRLTAWLQDYMQKAMYKTTCNTPDIFKVHISIVESRCFVHNQQQCMTTQVSPPLKNLFFV